VVYDKNRIFTRHHFFIFTPERSLPVFNFVDKKL